MRVYTQTHTHTHRSIIHNAIHLLSSFTRQEHFAGYYGRVVLNPDKCPLQSGLGRIFIDPLFLYQSINFSFM